MLRSWLLFRRKLRAEHVTAPYPLPDLLSPATLISLLVVLTGPTTGSLGGQTAIFLAAGKPSQILLLGRNASKSESVIQEIQSISPSTSVQFIAIDLTRYESIRSAAAVISKTVDKIDVLINGAGVMSLKDFTLTPEDIEIQFGANHIGHFLLTNLLLPKILAAGKGARIVTLSSNSMELGPVRFDDYNFQDGKVYDRWDAYAQSKTANVLFTKYLAQKLAPKGILAFTLHPGMIWTGLGVHVEEEQWPIVKQKYDDVGKSSHSPLLFWHALEYCEQC